jgi:hypothetical protein
VGKVFDGIDDALTAWIGAQPVWFVATAPLAADGHVNVSPRGHDSFSVLDRHRVGWVDLTGSDVETIAHVRENGRVCVMFAPTTGGRASCACTVAVRWRCPVSRLSTRSRRGTPTTPARAPLSWSTCIG